MNPIKISLNVLHIEGAKVLTLKDENGRPVYYVGIPCTQLFIPQGSTSQAHLQCRMYETPNNQFADFAIKPYVSKAQFDAMSEEQKKAIPFIGKGAYVMESTPTSMTQQAAAVEVSSELPFTPPADGTDCPFG